MKPPVVYMFYVLAPINSENLNFLLNGNIRDLNLRHE